MITKDELMACCFGGLPDPNDERIEKILKAVNIVRSAYNKPMIPSCFYRSVEWDKSKGRSGLSQHCKLSAVDFKDSSGELDKWCENNLDILEKAGLYLESPAHTKGWCHLDLKERKNRVFIP